MMLRGQIMTEGLGRTWRTAYITCCAIQYWTELSINRIQAYSLGNTNIWKEGRKHLFWFSFIRHTRARCGFPLSVIQQKWEREREGRGVCKPNRQDFGESWMRWHSPAPNAEHKYLSRGQKTAVSLWPLSCLLYLMALFLSFTIWSHVFCHFFLLNCLLTSAVSSTVFLAPSPLYIIYFSAYLSKTLPHQFCLTWPLQFRLLVSPLVFRKIHQLIVSLKWFLQYFLSLLICLPGVATFLFGIGPTSHCCS